MGSFADAYKREIQNAHVAEQNNKQIEKVFERFSNELAAASEQRIAKVVVEVYSKFISKPNSFSFDALGSGFEMVDTVGLIVYWQQNVTGKTLCDVTFGAMGYPVTLTFGGLDVRCNDKEALEAGLLQLLEHPDTGRILNAFSPT